MKNLLQDNLEGNVTFKKIFVTYYARIVYFAFQIIGDREEAEDIAQDTFVNFWNQKENVSQHEVAIKNYLYLTAKNLCLNQIRHNNIVKDYQAKNQFSIFDDTDIVNAILDSLDLLEILYIRYSITTRIGYNICTFKMIKYQFC